MQRRERNLILGTLLILAAISWVVVFQQSALPGEHMGIGAPLFIMLWVVMMAAMMFPAVAPMVLAFAQVQTHRRAGSQFFVPTWIFVGAYILVWTVFGVLAWVAAAGVEAVAHQTMWLMDN